MGVATQFHNCVWGSVVLISVRSRQVALFNYCRQLRQQYIGVKIADSLNPSNVSDKGENNLIDIDPRDQHGQSGKIHIHGVNNYIDSGYRCASEKVMHIAIESNRKFDIGGDVRSGVANLYIGLGSVPRVGDRTGFTGIVHLNPVEAKAIEIGTDCSIASGVRMTTSSFHSIISWSGGTRLNPARPVRVGNHVWIANHATPLERSTNLR